MAGLDIIILDAAWRPRDRVPLADDWRAVVSQLLALDGQWLALSAMALAAGVGVRAYLELDRRRKASSFGVIGLDREKVVCVPGGEISVVLSMERWAKAVAAVAFTLVVDTSSEGHGSRIV